MGLAQSLDLELVAEGVETEAQRTLLTEMGCDHIQGWLVSQALPSDELAQRFEARTLHLHEAIAMQAKHSCIGSSACSCSGTSRPLAGVALIGTCMALAAIDMVKAAVLDRLWTRMSERGDFPMLSQSLRSTVSAMSNDDLDFTGLVQVVLSDFGLTQKVLRLANSAMYMAFGGNITTVTRALMVLGMDAVGHLVVGLKLVDHFHHSAPRRIDAKLELNRTLLSGGVARKLTENTDLRSAEEAVVCTLMRQIGKLLVVVLSRHRVGSDAPPPKTVRRSPACCRARRDLRGNRHRGRRALASARRDPRRHEASSTRAADEQPRHVRWLQAVTNYSTEVADALTAPATCRRSRETRLVDIAHRYSDAR